MTSTRCRWSTVLLASLLPWISACHSKPSPAAVTAALWLPDDAVIEPDATRPIRIENGRSIFANGSGAVVFRLDTTCDSFAEVISRRFADTGWSERATQYLNPEQPTSFKIGCHRYGGR